MQNTDLFGEVSIRKFEKELTINFFFTWPDETNQAHDGDLMVRSAVCQNWLMCPFRGWQATWSPKSQTNFSQNPLTNQTQRDSFSQLSFVLSLKHNDFFFLFFVQPLCFELNSTQWPQDVIYDRELHLPFKMSNV